MIILVDALQIDELPGRRFVDLAVSSDPDRHGLNIAHAGIASNGYKMHISTEEGNECGCGDEKIHKALNDSLDRVTSEAPFVFAISRAFLLEALAGIPGSEHAGEIYFHYSTKDKAVVITSSDMKRAAVIMPMNIDTETTLRLPRIISKEMTCNCDIQGSSNCQVPGHKEKQ